MLRTDLTPGPFSNGPTVLNRSLTYICQWHAAKGSGRELMLDSIG